MTTTISPDISVEEYATLAREWLAANAPKRGTAEGEAAATPAEPEVLKKGKKEEETAE